MYDKLSKILHSHHQEHLLAYWNSLSNTQQTTFANQLDAIDWNYLDDLIEKYIINTPKAEVNEDIQPAPYFPIKPESQQQAELYKQAKQKGRELLETGKIAALTVAGGQGTRLGFDGPKGTYPITPLKKKSLFQYFSESIIRVQEKYGKPLPWYIMTSDMNNQATKKFFVEHNYFGLDPSNITFFIQGTMPAIQPDGKLILSSKYSLALAPNGHGGTLLALRQSGCLDSMAQLGIEYISYFQVDNPLVSVVDPLFIGLHCLKNSEMSARMLPKTGPFEKLGNFCLINGTMQIIEYSDLPDELAEQRDNDGKLRFIAGSPAIHIFSRSFIENLTVNNKLELPWHRAEKKVPFLDAQGNIVKPETPNAVKLETFIFDALPLAKKTLVLEAVREEEFAPTKNASGVDSVESCRQMLISRDASRLERAGLHIPRKEDNSPNCILEISPLVVLDDDDAFQYVNTHKASIKTPAQDEEVYYR